MESQRKKLLPLKLNKSLKRKRRRLLMSQLNKRLRLTARIRRKMLR